MQSILPQVPAESLHRTAKYWIAAGLLLAGIISVCTVAASSQLIGRPAPDFTLPSLVGGNMRLSDNIGAVIVLNFWATSCGWCREEIPVLEGLYEKYGRAGMVLYGINLDEDRGRAADMARTLKVSYPVLFDERKTASRSYQLDTMPITVLIDREGIVRLVSVGYRPGYEKRYGEKLRELLNE